MALDPQAVQEVLSAVPAALRALSADKEKLAARIAGYERKDKAEEIVTMMDARGLSDPTTPFQTKVASLLASEKDLDVVKKAVAMSSSGVSLGTLSEGPAGTDESLEGYLLG